MRLHSAPTRMLQASGCNRGQSGAALVVGLILLLAISVMAIANVNSVSMELIATGNEQYRIRAFQSAETAIERAIRNGAAFDSATDYSMPTNTTTGIGRDSFRYEISRPSAGMIEQAPAGNSESVFGAIYFRITATGYSDHDKVAENIQELYQVVQAPDSISYDSRVCKSTTSLDRTSVSC